MSQRINGFTLLEMIVVILLLGIVAAVAIPRFLDIAPDARQSATEGVAGALTAASANNYGVRKANGSKGSAVDNCTDVGSLQVGLLPSGYVITPLAIADDASVSCTVTNPDGVTTSSFIGLGVL